jgi:hypothetical protein
VDRAGIDEVAVPTVDLRALQLYQQAWNWAISTFGPAHGAAAEAADWARICWNSPYHGACDGSFGAYFFNPLRGVGLQNSWSQGVKTLLGSGGVFAGVILPNRLLKAFEQEQEAMDRAGVQPRPVSPGDPGWSEVIGSNDTIKWAVLEDGSLVVMPKFVDGTEVPHSFLSGGEGVRAAGEAEISSAPGSAPFGVSITNFSGHFEPPAESLQMGVDAFAAADISFAMEDPYVGE